MPPLDPCPRSRSVVEGVAGGETFVYEGLSLTEENHLTKLTPYQNCKVIRRTLQGTRLRLAPPLGRLRALR